MTLLLWLAVAAAPLAFLGLFYAYPLWSILADTLNLGILWEVWQAKADILWFTLWQAGLSTALTVAAAMPVAYVLARFSFRGKSQLKAALLVPFVLPTVVVATAMTALFDRLGAQEVFQHSLGAILLAHVFFNFAVVARTLGTFWGQLSRAPEEAAMTLGASPGAGFLAGDPATPDPGLAGHRQHRVLVLLHFLWGDSDSGRASAGDSGY